MSSSTAILADQCGERLGWQGFRRLSPAEAAAGPFAREATWIGFLRLDAAAYNVASVSCIGNEVEAIHFLEHQALGAWGYDINIGGQAHCIATINEVHLAITREQAAIAAELAQLGFGNDAGCWLRQDVDCLIPALGPHFSAGIFPCLGWVLAREATSEFGLAEQHSGFCTTSVPPGALANHASRAFRFVYGGYAQRPVLRRRIIALIDPQASPNEASAVIEGAITLSYRTPWVSSPVA